jgi:hypothetical protein
VFDFEYDGSGPGKGNTGVLITDADRQRAQHVLSAAHA